MTDKQEKFIRRFTEQAPNHHDWLDIMEFALPTLKNRPSLLLSLVVAECDREAVRNKWPTTDDHADRVIFQLYELGLGIEDRKK